MMKVERRRDGDWTPCARCGKSGLALAVRLVTPDMDIEPVPLCLICRFTMFDAEVQANDQRLYDALDRTATVSGERQQER